MSRRDVRTGIATYFGGSTYDAVSRIYRPTPLAAAGLAGVRLYFAKRVPDSDYTFGLAEGRAMGTLMVLHLPNENETRIAIQGATAGIKRQTYSIELHLYHLAQTQHSEDAQADFDDVLDAIVEHIRADRTLGGIVVQAGEGDAGITKTMSEPFINGERTESYGVVRFDAHDFPTA